LACMPRDFDIFMSKHLAGQWLLNSYNMSKFRDIRYKSLLLKRIELTTKFYSGGSKKSE
jgi:hypothetical protein